jgi:hypothetical protein
MRIADEGWGGGAVIFTADEGGFASTNAARAGGVVAVGCGAVGLGGAGVGVAGAGLSSTERLFMA